MPSLHSGDNKFYLIEGQCRLEVRIDVIGKEYTFQPIWVKDGDWTYVVSEEEWNNACYGNDFPWPTEDDMDAWFENHAPMSVLPAGAAETFKDLEMRWHAVNMLVTVY
jgi:hypothetical protein